METSAPAQSASGRYPRVASSIHLILVLAAIGGWAIAHKIFTDQLSATANPNRVHFYVITLLYEWLLFVLVVVGVRRSGASALMVLGEHWHSGRQVLRDIGIAVGFWIVAVILLSIFGWLLRTAALGRNVSMLPHGGIELTLWIALSVTAGICEETIFRGYLQRQFMALTQSAPAGILLSAAAFGAAHAYQGFRMVILIGLYGGMFGILAYWRGSVRPGMIAHAWNDSWNGVLASLVRHQGLFAASNVNSVGGDVVWVVARGLRPSHGQPGSYQLARWVSTDALVLTGLANLRVVGYEPQVPLSSREPAE